jgi:hypothetical protein
MAVACASAGLTSKAPQQPDTLTSGTSFASKLTETRWDYGSEGWGFESLRARSNCRSEPLRMILDSLE